MTQQFNWDFDEETPFDEPSAPSPPPPWWQKRPFLLLTIAVVLAAAGFGGWRYTRNQLAQVENELRGQVQIVLDQAQAAQQAGNGDQFFATQSLDPAWQAAQLRPDNQAVYRSGLRATRVQQQGDFLWVNAAWQASEAEPPLQRLLFFQWQGGRLVQVGSDPQYWGARRSQPEEWGQLLLYTADQQWGDELAAFVANTVADLCAGDCLTERLPLTLAIGDGYEKTAVMGQLTIPSPRLLGLDEGGNPNSRYWQQLQQKLVDYLTPATVRVVVPPTPIVDEQLTQLNVFYAASRDFMAANPAIKIEITALDATDDGMLAFWLERSNIPVNVVAYDPTTTPLLPLLAEFDAVGATPTLPMLQAGLVQDLTSFVRDDVAFDEADFYEQVWQGIVWRERVWQLPYAASMRLVYYDRMAYQQAGLREPSLRWTWDEMVVSLRGLTTNPPITMPTQYGFIDASTDLLYAYAYNWENSCTETATVRCQQRLLPQNVSVALDWYQQMSSQPNFTPNVASLSVQERLDKLRSERLLQQQVAIWVDVPGAFEDYALGRSVGVVPFPGSDRFDGITPLHVHGAFMTQMAERPFATWQWLKFLTHYPLPPSLRHIPARPSVAAQVDFWQAMPPALANVMRTAFPFARPIWLEEQEAITWPMVRAVVAEGVLPEEAAQPAEPSAWFTLQR